MIAQLNEEIKEISAEEISGDMLTLAVLSFSEFKAYEEKLGIPFRELKPFQVDFDENSCVICIKKPSTDIENNREESIYIILKQKLFAVIDSDSETKEHFLKSLGSGKNAFSVERTVSSFLYSLTHDDIRELDEIENRISQLEDSVLGNGETDNVNSEILKIKQKLLKLRSFYEQLSDIADVLAKNENGLLNGKRLKLFKDFGTSMDKLTSKVDFLRESLVQLREAYQAEIDLKLNNTMKIFTVIATIFLPLTLITGWYGMNFRFMPELNWRFGYVYVIVLSLVIAVGCIVYFKKKKLM